ncbi:hypothetical protein [Stackebrandtia nassauensis]|uniref:Integral membrane protein n=1 Tax=Stackebrandtia nassauensis (strain DSM 44728 / CIP 108903 / NRRL B-16338 / NBRC 102104 / LLR-40K-21) TaxID=446470 RepID=D3Q3X7_STANL|nr:hypothetical protein [Stackebrandtia nassauensis]ADD44044.1 hypothetical protein Snas_4398 [Stackebrandtia nassauensis DSM 44728]
MSAAWLGVLIAFVGAFSYALGAAIQQLDAVKLGANRALLKQPRWWIGGAISFLGACLHAVALIMAPLTIIQPISMTTLVYAVPLAAKLHGRKPRRAELLGSVAVSIGLAGLMAMIPLSDNKTPTLDSGPAIGFLVGVLAFVAVTQFIGSRATGPHRALFYALGAGVATGTVSTFVRLVGAGASEDFAQLFHWFSLVVPSMLILATILLQRAYAIGYFGIAYAVAQVSDPVASVLAGAGLLGEPLPTNPSLFVPALLCGALLIAGTIVLGRNAPDTGHVKEPVPELVRTGP